MPQKYLLLDWKNFYYCAVELSEIHMLKETSSISPDNRQISQWEEGEEFVLETVSDVHEEVDSLPQHAVHEPLKVVDMCDGWVIGRDENGTGGGHTTFCSCGSFVFAV